MANKDVGLGKEFPTEWHREAYLTNLQRELAGARLRGDEDQAVNAQAELKRLGAVDDSGEPKRKPGRPPKEKQPEPEPEPERVSPVDKAGKAK